MLKKISLLALALNVACFGALAASHHKMVFLNQYDLDGDWQLYLSEFDHARLKRFTRTDENNDGLVNEAEYVYEYQNKLDRQLNKDRKGQLRQTEVRFEAMDKNENGRMEWSEYEASGLRSFTRYDINEDEQIDEVDGQPESRRRANSENLTRVEQDARRDRQLAFAQRVLRMPTTHNKEGMMVKYDLNGDQVITRTEHTQRRREDFDRTDENGDGWLSEQEYIFEYLNRVDTQIAKTRKAAIKQTKVRFDALDSDGNGTMTFVEYQTSGHRSFVRWDTNDNQQVTMDEALPPPREQAKETASVSQPSARTGG